MAEVSIANHKVAEIHYTLTDDQGEVIDTSRDEEPLPYIHGTKVLVPGLEKELEGKVAGDKIEVTIPPAEAYGEIIPEFKKSIARDLFQFDGDIEVGMRFEADGPDGIELVTVIAVDDENITIDTNHPLAGETLNFDVEVVSVRDATEEELQHGHAHGAGGCDH